MTLQSHSWPYIQNRQKTIVQKDTCIPMFIAALFIFFNLVFKSNNIYCFKIISRVISYSVIGS